MTLRTGALRRIIAHMLDSAAFDASSTQVATTNVCGVCGNSAAMRISYSSVPVFTLMLYKHCHTAYKIGWGLRDNIATEYVRQLLEGVSNDASCLTNA